MKLERHGGQKAPISIMKKVGLSFETYIWTCPIGELDIAKTQNYSNLTQKKK